MHNEAGKQQSKSHGIDVTQNKPSRQSVRTHFMHNEADLSRLGFMAVTQLITNKPKSPDSMHNEEGSKVVPAYHCLLGIWNLVIKSTHLLRLYTSDDHEEGINYHI
jgi:hypothetical protein